MCNKVSIIWKICDAREKLKTSFSYVKDSISQQFQAKQ